MLCTNSHPLLGYFWCPSSALHWSHCCSQYTLMACLEYSDLEVVLSFLLMTFYFIGRLPLKTLPFIKVTLNPCYFIAKHFQLTHLSWCEWICSRMCICMQILGVVISSDLSWSNHTMQMPQKPGSRLGFYIASFTNMLTRTLWGLFLLLFFVPIWNMEYLCGILICWKIYQCFGSSSIICN